MNNSSFPAIFISPLKIPHMYFTPAAFVFPALHLTFSLFYMPLTYWKKAPFRMPTSVSSSVPPPHPGHYVPDSDFPASPSAWYCWTDSDFSVFPVVLSAFYSYNHLGDSMCRFGKSMLFIQIHSLISIITFSCLLLFPSQNHNVFYMLRMWK